MTRLGLVLAAGLLVAADLPKADTPKEDAAKADLKKMQGPWRLVSGERNGQKMTEEDVKGTQRTFTDDKFEAKRNGVSIIKGTVKLDPAQKPKAIDVTVAAPDGTDVTLRGIYEIDGDDMKTCLAQPDDDRPKEFSSKEGSGHMNYVWKREKKRRTRSAALLRSAANRVTRRCPRSTGPAAPR
jgi:uncharacterized protein (TIGR03067 family)